MSNSSQLPLILLLAASVALSVVFGNPIPVVFVTVVLFATALFKVLWNDTIPRIFAGARRITFWESFRLLLLGWLLSGGVFIRFLFAR